VITGAGAVVAVAATVAVSVAQTGRLAALADALGGAALLLLAFALVLRFARIVPWVVLAAGAAYLTGRAGDSVVDGKATLVGAALLLAAELATWSIEHDARVTAERALTIRRAARLGGLVGAAFLVNVILLGIAGVSAGSDVLLAAVGVAASVSSIALIVRLARRAAA
jgi:hypothetical protein